MNRITEVKLSLINEHWLIEVTKEFSPEYGGGSTVFKRSGGKQIHNALRAAAEMVTLTPTNNPDVKKCGPGFCPGCGKGMGWIERNPALHEQNCGGVGKTIWERKGIQVSEERLAEVGPIIASIEAAEDEAFPPTCGGCGNIVGLCTCDPPSSYDYDSDGNPKRNGVNP